MAYLGSKKPRASVRLYRWDSIGKVPEHLIGPLSLLKPEAGTGNCLNSWAPIYFGLCAFCSCDLIYWHPNPAWLWAADLWLLIWPDSWFWSPVFLLFLTLVPDLCFLSPVHLLFLTSCCPDPADSWLLSCGWTMALTARSGYLWPSCDNSITRINFFSKDRMLLQLH